MQVLVKLWLAIVVCCAVPLAGAASNYEVEAPARVVTFGDVHGAYTGWRALLLELELSP
jgi:hypothetical protein